MPTREEVGAAVKAAHEAFKEWRRVPAVNRAKYLFELKQLKDCRMM
jgi:acyl-CoA reductase-like NAD-dependent aldehyde dehydrogenase